MYTNTVSKAMFPPSSRVQINSVYSEYILQVLSAKKVWKVTVTTLSRCKD